MPHRTDIGSLASRCQEEFAHHPTVSPNLHEDNLATSKERYDMLTIILNFHQPALTCTALARPSLDCCEGVAVRGVTNLYCMACCQTGWGRLGGF